jgi:hypothetical protein
VRYIVEEVEWGCSSPIIYVFTCRCNFIDFFGIIFHPTIDAVLHFLLIASFDKTLLYLAV